jgi:quinoprotein glucose dehydrogenase
MGKQGWLYVFDRITGQPVWPIEEKPVPQGDVPGEWYSPTQPHPTKPPPYDHQGVTIDNLVDFTPELRAEAIKLLSQYKLGPIFTPLPEQSRRPDRRVPVVRKAPTGRLMIPRRMSRCAAASWSLVPLGLLPPPNEFSDANM